MKYLRLLLSILLPCTSLLSLYLSAFPQRNRLGINPSSAKLPGDVVDDSHGKIYPINNCQDSLLEISPTTKSQSPSSRFVSSELDVLGVQVLEHDQQQAQSQNYRKRDTVNAQYLHFKHVAPSVAPKEIQSEWVGGKIAKQATAKRSLPSRSPILPRSDSTKHSDSRKCSDSSKRCNSSKPQLNRKSPKQSLPPGAMTMLKNSLNRLRVKRSATKKAWSEITRKANRLVIKQHKDTISGWPPSTYLELGYSLQDYKLADLEPSGTGPEDIRRLEIEEAANEANFKKTSWKLKGLSRAARLIAIKHVQDKQTAEQAPTGRKKDAARRTKEEDARLHGSRPIDTSNLNAW